MKYTLRNLLLTVLAVALVLRFGIPAFERLTFDPVVNAVAHLETHNPKFIRFLHNGEWQGDYWAVDLTGARLNDGDLAYVRTINPMGEIVLSDSNVSDDDLWALVGADACLIDLSGTTVSDAAILSLANCARLSHLDVSRTSIRDVSMLKNNQSLLNLNLSNTNVLDADIDELQKSLPNCRITR
jgi:hypothetical protein